jgi:flagellar biosynthetic protein FliP
MQGLRTSSSRRRSKAEPQKGFRFRFIHLAIPITCLWLIAPVFAQDTEDWDSLGAPRDPASEAQAVGEDLPEEIEPADLSQLLANPEQLTTPTGLASSIRIMLLLTVISLAPAILLMTTSFIRIVVVLGLLRQAIGAQQLPPSQVITSLALFMTVLIMAPVWNEIKDEAIIPYTDQTQQLGWEEAWDRGVKPVKGFMSKQISLAGNSEDVWLFFEYLPESEQQTVPTTFDEVPLKVLLPAFMISELKVAFLIGFQVFLPFLIIDIVVSSVAISMGMMMLPPQMISLPFKLMLFVLVDGWHLVIGMLLESFAPFG